MDLIENNKEIILHKDAKTLLKKGINDLAEAVLLTMGPAGRTVIIPDTDTGGYKITKDGVSVAKSISFRDPVANIGAQLIKEVAENTRRKAGDATTTAICLANAFINKGFELNLSSKELVEELDSLEKHTLDSLDSVTRPLKKENIRDVATIAANGDKNLGELIQKAFNFSNVIQINYGTSDKDDILLIDGMQLKSGIFDNAFITNMSNQSIEYDNPLFIIVEGHLSSLGVLDYTIKNTPITTPIIIMADDFSGQVVKILKENYNRGALLIGLIKSPGYAEHRKNLVSDLIVATGGTSRNGISIGRIKSIQATTEKTMISFERTPKVQKLLVELKKAYKKIKEDYSKELMQQRIDNLEGTLAVIVIGGKSELEMKERYDRIEDAILATKCAIEEGIIEGAGLPLCIIGSSSMGKYKFADCLEAPRLQIEKNGCKLDMKGLATTSDGISIENVLLKDNSIVDPVKVTKIALSNAISVAKTILGTEAIVL